MTTVASFSSGRMVNCSTATVCTTTYYNRMAVSLRAYTLRESVTSYNQYQNLQLFVFHVLQHLNPLDCWHTFASVHIAHCFHCHWPLWETQQRIHLFFAFLYLDSSNHSCHVSLRRRVLISKRIVDKMAWMTHTGVVMIPSRKGPIPKRKRREKVRKR